MGRTVIGIDGGKNGAIAVAKNGDLKVFKMPAGYHKLIEFFSNYDPAETTVFIEKVQLFTSDDKGKQFGIMKMIQQVDSIKHTLMVQDFQFIEIAAVTWQSRLNLRKKGEEKPERKTRYWEWAKRYAPLTRIHKYQGDAVCILACGLKLFKERDPLVVKEDFGNTELF